MEILYLIIFFFLNNYYSSKTLLWFVFQGNLLPPKLPFLPPFCRQKNPFKITLTLKSTKFKCLAHMTTFVRIFVSFETKTFVIEKKNRERYSKTSNHLYFKDLFLNVDRRTCSFSRIISFFFTTPPPASSDL